MEVRVGKPKKELGDRMVCIDRAGNSEESRSISDASIMMPLVRFDQEGYRLRPGASRGIIHPATFRTRVTYDRSPHSTVLEDCCG